MRIALVIGGYDARGGGAERWTDQYARYLLRRGHEVHLVSQRFREPPEGAQCHLVPRCQRGWLSNRLTFAQEAEALTRWNRFDVVHDMGDGWHADVFMPHHGTRRGGFEQNSRLLPGALRGLRRLAWRTLPRYRDFRFLERRQYDLEENKRFVALSEMVRRHMQQYHALPSDRIEVVYNGVDVERFLPPWLGARGRDRQDHGPEHDRRRVRSALGMADVTVFGIVAHNFELKGLGPLLNAFAILARQNERIGLVIVGAGPVGRYLRMAQRLGCQQLVRFVGEPPDPRPYYQAADVYVHPTYYDPCSLVVLEAMACGLPVITTRHNGAGELIRQGQEGWVLDEPDDTNTLAEAMGRFLDEEYRRTAALHARRLAESRSLVRNFEEVFALYSADMPVRAAA